MGASSRENLLVAKGVLGPMGGAERDLIRILASLNELFSVSVPYGVVEHGGRIMD